MKSDRSYRCSHTTSKCAGAIAPTGIGYTTRYPEDTSAPEETNGQALRQARILRETNGRTRILRETNGRTRILRETNGRTRRLSDDFQWTPPTLESIEEQRAQNDFLMDFENYVLTLWDARKGIPTGPHRFEDEAWAALMKTQLEFSDTCWDEYVAWVRSGGGDEWFQPVS